jgi:hypothetical protein
MKHVPLLCLVGVALLAAPLMANPISMVEQWDTYALGTGDPAYNANWATLAGANRYAVDNSSPNSAPNDLKIQKLQTYGITRDLSPELNVALPGGTLVLGTDGDVLTCSFVIDFNGINKQEEDIIVELSKGNVHTDGTNGTSKDVVAFGMTYGWFGSSTHPRIFDGTNWIHATGVITDKRFNQFTLEVRTNQLTLIGGRKASGSHTTAREYLGGFDTITIRTISQNDQTHYYDDTILTGGVVVPEPATLMLLGLGGVFLRRRR